MARKQRDYKAEYRARVERAQRLGLTKAQATGHAKRAKLPSITELRREGKYRYTPKKARRVPKVVDTAAGRLVNTVSAREIKAQLKAAAQQGQRVSIQLTIDKGDGRGPRTRVLDGRGAQGDLVAGGGAGGGGESGVGRADIVGKVQMVVGGADVTRGGFDPQALLDFFDGYGSIWDAIGDLADSEYG